MAAPTVTTTPTTLTLPDADLYAYAGRAKDQVVVITGAGNGLGKAAAMAFQANGAKVVVGDVDVKGAETTVAEIEKAGGTAAFIRCDVTKWDDLVGLFEFATSKYGGVDIVVANAGVAEVGSFMKVEVDGNGKPLPPNVKTITINLDSVLNTAHLAVHYFRQTKNEKSIKTLVLMGSIASVTGLPTAPLYSTSKHGVLGFMRAAKLPFETEGLRVAMVAPWFADTGILSATSRAFVAGLALTPVGRVGSAIFRAATDADSITNGALYIIPDQHEVYRMLHTQLDQGMYAILNERVKSLFDRSVL